MKKLWTGLLKMNARKLKIINFLICFLFVIGFYCISIKDKELFQSLMIAFLSLGNFLTLQRVEKLEKQVNEPLTTKQLKHLATLLDVIEKEKTTKEIKK